MLRAKAERVFKAFLDGDAMVKWLPPNGFTGKMHHIDPQVGGTYEMSFTNFSTGKSHSFGGKFGIPGPPCRAGRPRYPGRGLKLTEPRQPP